MEGVKMAEKNITMKRKTAQGWDVYYPKTKGGNIIQDGKNRLVTDAEKKTWNTANELVESMTLSDAEFYGRMLLQTPMIVMNPNDKIYADSGVPSPPVGGVFNNYNQETGKLGINIDASPVAWAVISLYHLYSNAETQRVKDLAVQRIKTISEFICKNTVKGDFYGRPVTVFPSRFQFKDGKWQTMTGEIYFNAILLIIRALTLAFNITGDVKYKNTAMELMDTFAIYHYQISERVQNKEIDASLDGAFYDFLVKSGDKITPNWGQIPLSNAYFFTETHKDYKRVFGTAKRTVGTLSYTVDEIFNRHKQFMERSYKNGKMTSRKGLPYAYFIAEGMNVKPCNWDFLKGVYGDTWFVGDTVLWTIVGMANLGLHAQAKVYMQKMYDIRVQDTPERKEGKEILFYDRYDFEKLDHLADDDSISITFTGLFFHACHIVGLDKYYTGCITPMLKYAIVSNDPMRDGAYAWTIHYDYDVLEFKSFGEIYNTEFFKYANPISATNLLKRSKELSEELNKKADSKFNISGGLITGQTVMETDSNNLQVLYVGNKSGGFRFLPYSNGYDYLQTKQNLRISGMNGADIDVVDVQGKNITLKGKPVALKEETNKAFSDAKAYVDGGWNQKHRMTLHDGTAVGLEAETDLNTVLNTGFYRGNKLKNTPTGESWHYVMVTKHTDSYVMQVASVLDNGFHKDKNTLFIRHMINKVWTAWRAISLREDWGLWGTNGGQDLLARGKRVAVAQADDKLVVNYNGDFKNGVYVHSSLTTTGSVIAGNGLVNDKGYFEIGSYNTATYGTGRMQSFYDANNKTWKVHAKDDKNAQVPIKMQLNGKDVATSDDIAKQVSKTGDTMSGNLNFDKSLNGVSWNMNTDYAKVYFKNDSDADTDSYLAFETGDNGNEHFKWLTRNGSVTSEMMKLNQSGLIVKGKSVAINEEVDAKLNKKLNKTSDTTDDLHMINPKVVAGNSDHGYLAFFPRTKDPKKRGAYIGYGSAGANLMTISNEIGDININSQGKVTLNNKEVATKDEVASLVAGVGQKHKLTQDDGRPISASGKSANDLQATGYYMGADMKDMALPSASNWWFIEIMRHATGWVHQRATWFNTSTVETYERILNNNTWQPWKKTVTPQGWGLWRTNGGQDLLVHDKRAMVGFPTNSGNRLELNYGKDFASGVNIQGKLTNDGQDVIHNGWNFMRDRSVTALVQDDWNAITESGMYLVSDDGKNPKHASIPPNCYPYGVLEVYRTGSNQAIFQRYTSHSGGQVFVRGGWAKASWSAWRRLADEDLVNARLPLTGGTVTGDIISKGKEYVLHAPTSTGGWARGLRYFGADGKTDLGGIGLYGAGTASQHMYMSASPSPWGAGNGLFVYKDGTIKAKGNLTLNEKKVATVDDVNAGDAKQVSKAGDTMTGQLNVNTAGDKSTPIVAQNASGKIRILPYAGDDNYIQSGTTADEAKNLRITGYNGKEMSKVHVHATNTTTSGSLVVGKDINVSGGGTTASNIFFQDHTHIFSRADRTGFHDTKNKKTSLAIDNTNKAVQIESGYNLRVINGGKFEAGNFAISGQDLLVHGKRAMVGTANDRIHINYAKDMPNGVVSNGKFQVNDGQIHVTQNGKNAVIGCGANDAYLHNSKSGKYLQLKDDGTFSYDGKKVALTDEASHVKWSTFTNFQNGFKPLPEGHALFYGIDQFGFKHIRGLVQGGSTNAGAVIGKLPDFMKPSYWTSITATYDTTGAANYVPCAMHVGWGGELTVQNSRSAASFIVINGMYK